MSDKEQPLKKEENGNKSSPITINKTFAKNILKNTGLYNNIQVDISSKSHRKLENKKRIEHTKKQLQFVARGSSFRKQNTMYSDTIDKPVDDQATKKKIITPLQQVKKLVSDARKFDDMKASENDVIALPQQRKEFPRNNAVILDKSLLRNHLKHTTVHNRLQEEEEMWEQKRMQKKRDLSEGVFTRKRKTSSGGMYADVEGQNVKTTRIKASPPPVIKRNDFGKYTKKLLQLKEKNPNRWQHTGFKELYADQLSTKKKKKKIQPSSSPSKDSDDEEISAPRRVGRITKNDDDDIRTVKPLRQTSRDEDIYTGKPLRRKVSLEDKKVQEQSRKRRVVTGLHMDIEEVRVKKKTKTSEKWSHDGYIEQNTIVVEEEPAMKSVAVKKSAVVTLESSDDEVRSKPNKRVVDKNSDAVVVKRKPVVDKVTLKDTIHKNNRANNAKKTKRKVIAKKKRKDSSTSSSSSSSSNSSLSSDSSSSEEDERRKKKKKNSKALKVKATFSDYDSDLKPV